ncbi:apolipoprotein N-acyltransferase [Corynebacterium sp. H78]|uniref:apolipoprotein N-acyltransferase n=1 Tax=Corynebacterium sp. H78 TaxID=3133417 RepID=UPI00403FAB4B
MWKVNILRLGAAIAAGVAQFLSYQPIGLWWAGWCAAALLIAALLPAAQPTHDSENDQHNYSQQLIRPRWWIILLVGFLWSAATALTSLPWIASFVGNLPWLALAVLLGLLAIPTSFGIAWILASRLPMTLRLVGAAAWITAIEAVLSYWPFGGFPWLRLAWGQIGGPLQNLAVAGGAPIVSLATALLGGAVVALALRRFRAAASLTIAVALAAIVVTPFVSGEGDSEARTVRVAAVQGNVPRLGLDFNAQRLAVLENHVHATKRLAARVKSGEEPQPDVVLWPENSADVSPFVDYSAQRLIDDAATAINAPIVVGTFTYDRGTQNTMVVWDPELGAVSGPDGRHEKIYLQPFGEYMPLRDLLRNVTELVDLAGDMTPGAGDGVIVANGAKIGVATCYEVVFDRAYRNAVNNGATLLATPTNNATFGFTDMTYQQLAMSRMRAIEHQRAVVVSATSGVSAIVTLDGTVQSETEIFTQEVLTATLPLNTERTLATRFGGVIEWSIAACGVALLVLSILGTFRRSDRMPGK